MKLENTPKRRLMFEMATKDKSATQKFTGFADVFSEAVFRRIPISARRIIPFLILSIIPLVIIGVVSVNLSYMAMNENTGLVTPSGDFI